jgi:hypothetical protein
VPQREESIVPEDAGLQRRGFADAPLQTHIDGSAPRRESHDSSWLTLTYKLRFADLYWMWETSPGGLVGTVAFLGLGLVFMSALLTPGTYPVAQDVAAGFLCLAVAPFLVPLVMLLASGKFAMIGRTVELVIDRNGLQGWPVARFRDTSWPQLRHPRLESRVLVLPFSWPFADAWAVVPARAFSPAEFNGLLGVLNEHGFFLDGDHRSPMGRLLSLVWDHVSLGDRKTIDDRLATFPRLVASFPERKPGRFGRFRN